MTEIYEQEHNSMMNIIDEARQSFALTLDELRDEQQVLSLTADKISQFLYTLCCFFPQLDSRLIDQKDSCHAQDCDHNTGPILPELQHNSHLAF